MAKKNQNLDSIRLIAEALGVPEHAFFDSAGNRLINPIDDASQANELLTSFWAIKDPKVRSICLEFVRKHAMEQDNLEAKAIADIPIAT